MPAEALNMSSMPVSTFLEVDTDVSEDFVSLLARVSISPGREQPSTHSFCPVNFIEGTTGREQSMNSTVLPVQIPWSQDLALPPSNALRLIPFQAHHSVSMSEGSEMPPIASRPFPFRYKTELCVTFQENGRCKYGPKCQFAHGRRELRGLTRHPKYKTELCRSYHTTGYCPYGSRCNFIHDAEEQRFTGSNRERCPPPLLRQSISCSGIQSSSVSSLFSSSLSLYPSSLAASFTSISPFPSASSVTPISHPFASVGPGSSTCSPVTLVLPLFESVSPSSSTVQNPLVGRPLQISPWRQPRLVEERESLPQHEGLEDPTSVCGNSQDATSFPIFSFLSD